jgi:GAF domain-containing protein
LIREEGAELTVACERRKDSAGGLVGNGAAASGPWPDLPHLIVNYVDRLGRPVWIAAGQEHELFGPDPYMARHGQVAVLCVPLLHMRRALGVLFLEKQGQENRFSPA